MKKLLVLVVSLIIGLATLSACSSAPVEEETPTVECSTDFRVGLVTDTGGIDDKSFNQGTWEGIVRFAEDNNLCQTGDNAAIKYLQSAQDADYIPNLSTFADEAMDLIVAPGFLFVSSMTEIAASYPEQKMLIIDDLVDAPNVASAVFAANEGSFLVGVSAGLTAKAAGESIVGFIGGMEFPLIEAFEAGFTAGVYAAYPEATVLSEYTGSFVDAAVGQTLAAKQYDAGAYIIFHAAGASGNGMINEAKARAEAGETVWAIGVDKDQYDDGIITNGSSVMLTSMMKRVDVAAYTAAQMVMDGTFVGGTENALTFNLANGGVGLPEENPNLSAEVIAEVAVYAEKVVSGEIVVPTTMAEIE